MSADEGSTLPEPLAGRSLMGTMRTFPGPATWKVRGSASVYSEKFTWQARRVQRRLRAMHCKATFSAAGAFHRLGLHQPRCYPAVTSGAKNGCAAPFAIWRIATKHLISGGFSHDSRRSVPYGQCDPRAGH